MDVDNWQYIIIRSLGAMAALFIFTRILGKRQISQLTFFEYITGITIGDLAGFISTDVEANYLHGMVAMLIWFVVPYSIEWLVLKNRRLRMAVHGQERPLIKEGKVLEDNLKKERFSVDELLESLRNKNVFNVREVEFAMLETSGELSVLLKPEHRPLTPKDLQLTKLQERESQAVILDGEIIDKGLADSGCSREWLQTELDKLGVIKENIFLGQVDTYGQLYVDLYDDLLSIPIPQVRSLLLATLKKCQADLELFAATTKNENAKNMYTRTAKELDNVVQSLKMTLST